MPKSKRILLKLSGEALRGEDKQETFDLDYIKKVALAIHYLQTKGHQIGVVIGAGNIRRGRLTKGTKLDPVLADYSGMMGTVINSLVLANVLRSLGQKTEVLSAWKHMPGARDYRPVLARKYLQAKRVVIFAAGTGNPFFTTDTAAVLRAIEIKADKICKATTVRGVYSADPKIDKKAKFYPRLTYTRALAENLGVMDAAALALADRFRLPCQVFKFSPANLKLLTGSKNLGSIVSHAGS